MIPGPLAFVILALAAFRVFRLIGRDDLPPLPKWRTKLVGGSESGGVWTFRRPILAHWVTCPYCLGWWCCVAWWGLFWWQPYWVTVAATPFALSSIVAAWSSQFDPQ